MIKPLTISEFTSSLKELIETSFNFIYLVGEITNFKQHFPSGHYYFSLKDDSSQISAIMWKSKNISLNFLPENGDLVLVKGRITLYPSSGRYQVEVFEMEKQGLGNLQLELEKLKKKLNAEGLFDAKYKIPLEEFPEFPQNIAIVTSETGAVLQDIVKVTKKRYPLVNLYLYAVNVQGKNAISEIVNAIGFINTYLQETEIIVLARGGGSLEDLWVFNSEEIVRSIFNSKIIVVSAIGHETDFTLCDFVSDLRAPTPSAAMEMILPDIVEIEQSLEDFSSGLKNIIDIKINDYKLNIEYFYNNFHFNKPLGLINEFTMRTDDYKRQIDNLVHMKLNSSGIGLNNLKDLLISYSPDNILKRGFSIVFKEGSIVSHASRLDMDDLINIQFADGKLDAVIKEKNNGKKGR